MSDALGPLTFGKKEEQIFLGREIAQRSDYSADTAIRIDQEIKRFVTEATTSARSRFCRRTGRASSRWPTSCCCGKCSTPTRYAASSRASRSTRRPREAADAGAAAGRRPHPPRTAAVMVPPLNKPLPQIGHRAEASSVVATVRFDQVSQLSERPPGTRARPPTYDLSPTASPAQPRSVLSSARASRRPSTPFPTGASSASASARWSWASSTSRPIHLPTAGRYVDPVRAVEHALAMEARRRSDRHRRGIDAAGRGSAVRGRGAGAASLPVFEGWRAGCGCPISIDTTRRTSREAALDPARQSSTTSAR